MRKQDLFYSGGSAAHGENNSSRLILLAVFFFIGTVFGAFFGANFTTRLFGVSEFLGLPSAESSLLLNFVSFVWLHFLVILFGTSFLGIVFVPLLTMLKGFLFSYASATIIFSSPSHGMIMVVITLGLPALLAVPAFFAFSEDAFSRSAKILSLLRGDSCALMKKADRRVIIFIPLLIIAFILAVELVPYLLKILGYPI